MSSLNDFTERLNDIMEGVFLRIDFYCAYGLAVRSAPKGIAYRGCCVVSIFLKVK